jgi:molybdate transport system substrate-binding protein
MRATRQFGLRWAAAALALTSAFAPGIARATDIMVFAAASLTDALREIGSAYETTHGDHVAFNFGASSTLARQIGEGAPADVFFSADEAKMDGLEQRGRVLAGTRVKLLSNTLVAVVAGDSKLAIAGPNDLTRAFVRVLALAEPQSVPAGIYAKEYLRRAGVWREVVDKVVPTENVRAALAAVESGNADAAIVYKTDAAISRKVRVAYEVPASEAPEIAYPVAVMKASPHPDAARAFIEALSQPAAREVFRRYGFLVVGKPAK